MRPGVWFLGIVGGLILLLVMMLGGRIIDSLGLSQSGAEVVRRALWTVTIAVLIVILNRFLREQ